jgi:hypothetical protein
VSWRLSSILPVWLVAVVGAVLVGLYAGADYLDWLALVLAATIVIGFGLQLALRRREGLVTRLIIGVVGAFVVLVVATGVLAALHPGVPLLG